MLDFAALPLTLLIGAAVLFWAHPSSDPGSDDESLEESTIVIGCSIGALVVLWRTSLLAEPISSGEFAPDFQWSMLLRIAVALSSIVTAKVIGKEVGKARPIHAHMYIHIYIRHR